jgi:uncharacterized membrane protein
MNMRQFVGAWLIYIAVTFVMGFVWHLVLFKDLYRELAIFSRIDDPIVPLGFAAMLSQGAILAYLFPLLPHDRGPIANGLSFGLLLGVFMATSAVLAEAAKQRVTSLPSWLLVESASYLIQFGLSGIGIGLVFGRSAKAA